MKRHLLEELEQSNQDIVGKYCIPCRLSDDEMGIYVHSKSECLFIAQPSLVDKRMCNSRHAHSIGIKFTSVSQKDLLKEIRVGFV